MTALTLINARIIDPEAEAEFLGHVVIEDGLIVAVGEGDPAQTQGEVVDCGGKCLSPGLIDLGVKVSEPGERQKESFRTAGLAAAAGGVTTIVTRPDTQPPIDTPEILEFVHRRAIEDAPVRVHPIACLTKGREGRELSEIAFLSDAGAIAFSDADRPISDPKTFGRVAAYAAGLDALMIAHAQDPVLSDGAAATSGAYATKLGLPAVSPKAERIQIDRDATLIEGLGLRYHIDQVSTATGVEAVQSARARGIKMSCGVSIHHLTLNEFDVGDYRTFFKVKPPLRAETDRMAVVGAIADGAVDVICSMHTPQDEESKRLPFEYAASGAVGLETLLPAALQLYHSGDVPLPRLIRAMTLNPAKILHLDQGRMAVGAPGDLILFDPDLPFILDRAKLRSKSKNTPFDMRRMQGRVLRTIKGGKTIFGADKA